MKTSLLPVRAVLSLVTIPPLLSLSGSAAADSFRCGPELIREGMPAAEIRSRCGEPTSVDRVEEPVFARRPDGTTYPVGTSVKEYWLYDRGARNFPARLTVVEGVAEKIELLSRQ
jgi:hypothetical protein